MSIKSTKLKKKNQPPVTFYKKFVADVLHAHNVCRKKHGVPPLRLNRHLLEQSQECAHDLLFAKKIRRSRFPNVGENIYMVRTNKPNYIPKGNEAVSEWYQQRDQLVIGKEPSDNTGVNFSQVVWKDTVHLGVGLARFGDKIVIVCQYIPPGNICGNYAQNVLPEVDEKELQCFC